MRGVFWGVFWGSEEFCILWGGGGQEIANIPATPDITKLLRVATPAAVLFEVWGDACFEICYIPLGTRTLPH